MKIAIRFILKETFGCLLHHWRMIIVTLVIGGFSGICILAHVIVSPWAKLIQNIPSPLIESVIEKIAVGSLDSTQLSVIRVISILPSLVFFWVITVFLLRINNTIYRKIITLKKLLLTALKLTPRVLLFSLVQFLPVAVLGGCGYILYSKFLPLTVINGSIMAFLAVISLAAMPVFLIRFALVGAVIINQQCCGFAALRRSWQLTKGQWIPVVVGMILPIFLVSEWLQCLFYPVYMLYLYQQLTVLPTEELQ